MPEPHLDQSKIKRQALLRERLFRWSLFVLSEMLVYFWWLCGNRVPLCVVVVPMYTQYQLLQGIFCQGLIWNYWIGKFKILIFSYNISSVGDAVLGYGPQGWGFGRPSRQAQYLEFSSVAGFRQKNPARPAGWSIRPLMLQPAGYQP